ncbi:MAG: alkaline phosphatase family protein [Pseudomonadota bacterium]
MNGRQAPPRPKLVILGLDGVSRTLLDRLSDDGATPHLARLLNSSRSGAMNSALPEISPTAWTTFFTARSPGEHGIYGFSEFRRPGYEVFFNSSAEVKSPCLWDWLGLAGRRSVVLNVPLTYPARPLVGTMISGFVALDYNRACYPVREAEFLRRSGYRLEADFDRVHQDRDGFLLDLDQALAGRELLLDRFWNDDWDLFVLIVTDTDRLLHFFYREYLENGPISGYFLDFFSRVDRLAGRVIDLAEKLAEESEAGVFLAMLSDHGFAPVVEEFHLNRWLAERGFFTGVGPNGRAFALDPTRIYFNHRRKFQAGKLTEGERRGLAREITAGLLAEPAVGGVDPGTELYSGRQAGLAPDLVVRPRPGYEFKAKFNSGPIYSPSLLKGTHTYEDAFYLVREFGAGLGEGPVEVNEILDFGRLVFHLAGVGERAGSGRSIIM